MPFKAINQSLEASVCYLLGFRLSQSFLITRFMILVRCATASGTVQRA